MAVIPLSVRRLDKLELAGRQTQQAMGSQLLEQSLLSPLTTGSEIGLSAGPRILDRDGDFSQSRGRWRVSNTNSGSRAIAGSVRQRYSASAAEATTINANSSVASLPRRPRTPPPSVWDRLCLRSNGYCCCRETDSQPYLTPRRCWDDWFRKSILNKFFYPMLERSNFDKTIWFHYIALFRHTFLHPNLHIDVWHIYCILHYYRDLRWIIFDCE